MCQTCVEISGVFFEMDYRKLYKDYYGIDFGDDYVIHHIDRNRENNNIGNLLLLPLSLHQRLHFIWNQMEALSLTEMMYNSTICGKAQELCYDMQEILEDCQNWVRRKENADRDIYIKQASLKSFEQDGECSYEKFLRK